MEGYYCLKNGNLVTLKSKLANLAAIIDKVIIRVDGRL